MPRNTASNSRVSASKETSRPTSTFRRNSTPMYSMISRRFSTTSFSSLNGGMPKVRRPPIFEYRSNTTGVTPLRTRTSAHASPAGPAPTTATRFPVRTTLDMSGFQPCLNASSVMYFSMAPMLTAPMPSFSVHAPSHSLSCGQIRPHISGREFVWCESSAASTSLLCRRLGAVLRINLAKFLGAHLDGKLVGILARNIQELQVVGGHVALIRTSHEQQKRWKKAG